MTSTNSFSSEIKQDGIDQAYSNIPSLIRFGVLYRCSIQWLQNILIGFYNKASYILLRFALKVLHIEFKISDNSVEIFDRFTIVWFSLMLNKMLINAFIDIWTTAFDTIINECCVNKDINVITYKEHINKDSSKHDKT